MPCPLVLQVLPMSDQLLPDGNQELTAVNQVLPEVNKGLTSVSEDVLSMSLEDKISSIESRTDSSIATSDRKGVGLSHKPYRFTQEKKAHFLKLAVEFWPNMAAICKATGVSRWIVGYHRKHDPEFDSVLNEIDQMVCDEHEQMLRKQGMEPKGFLDRMAYLRAHRPELYNPAKVVKIEGYKMTQSERGERLAGLEGAIDAQIVSAYQTRKERLQAQREKRGELPSGETGARGE